MRVYLDLDGVLADFYGTARRLLKRAYSELPPEEAWGILGKTPNLFLNLPLLPDARALWEGVEREVGRPNMRVLTASPRDTGYLFSAPMDKRAWVHRHFDGQCEVHVVLGSAKKAAYAEPHAILIDDQARNIHDWEAAGGIGIHHRDAESSLKTLQEILAKKRKTLIL